MMKVKVSEEVSEVLNNTQGPSLNLSIYRFYKRITENYRGTSFDDWFDKNNITATDVENAFKHGWEVECEFQVGDIVKCNSTVFIVSEHDLEEDTIFQHNKKYYTLVCKESNREDLKHE